MLVALALLGAQVDWRWSAKDPITVAPADQKEATYRDCLGESAAMLSQEREEKAEYLTTTAFIGCREEHKAWQNAYRSELKAARPRITRAGIDEVLQSSHRSLLGWAEGIIFALQRSRYWDSRPPYIAPLQKKFEELRRNPERAEQPAAEITPRK